MPLAPQPSRRAACSRTTRPFTSCSDAFTSRRGTPPPPPRSCGARCGSIPTSPRRIASWALRSWRWVGSLKRSPAGTTGSASRAAPRKRRSGRTCNGRARPPGCSAMADDIRALSAQLAQDPQSLVFLRLGEALRRKGQLDAAMRVATNGLERHPHLADAHDLYARILTDKHDYERAFDEWDMAVRIAPHHTGALKGLAFLYFKVGDVDQAIEMIRGGAKAPAAAAPLAPAAVQSGALDEARVFAGLEGANEGLLLVDGAGRVLVGALKDGGKDVTDA